MNGWTTPRNETFFFLNRAEFKNSPEKFIRNVIHELAVSYDEKEKFGFLGIPNFAKLGIIPDENTDNVIQIITNPIIKHSLSVLRAFDVEDQILREMGVSESTVTKRIREMSCDQRVQFLTSKIAFLEPVLVSESLIRQIFGNAQALSENSQDPKMVQEMIRRLSKINIKIKASQGESASYQNENACEYFSRGWPFIPGTSFTGGPGPRTDGW